MHYELNTIEIEGILGEKLIKNILFTRNNHHSIHFEFRVLIVSI